MLISIIAIITAGVLCLALGAILPLAILTAALWAEENEKEDK